MGSPVRTTRVPAGRWLWVEPKVVATALAHRAAMRFTNPGTLFGSIRTTGVRVRRAAMIAGALAYPPMPTTTSAARTMGRTSRAASRAMETALTDRSASRVWAEMTRTGENGKPAAGTSVAS